MRAFLAVPVSRGSDTERVERMITAIPGLRPVRTPELHVTLKFLGEIGDGEARRISRGLSALRFQRFSFRIEGVSAFPAPARARVVYLSVSPEGFRHLYSEVMGLLNLGVEADFVPHITVARLKSPMDLRQYAVRLDGNTERFAEKVCLYRSDLRPDGPVYTAISCAQLM
ncbi:RNA 2',3'-cyclic phosphodiesterase [Thermogymnomonas acidicola]|uniref:RNA 2',3'-cyclic phosphodiesterase n=1 Tax=Thermogymnomonas acidicola TaxID=399579 RepID=A0AA37BPS5_9ARCH|nr:RNA 2',3'-cyclic phosphodiesterase [Thermogymnomonas acidicola]GGM67508.1 RNA 2',3'-cyclic phosphodiesterase [Thermogymnomonas acidicola]